MTSSDEFELDIIDEKSRAGSEFMFRIAQELQRAFLAEKKEHKITQQSIAEKLETSRAVINRQLQGLENIGSRRIGELFWALGYEPYFEARKISERDNDFCARKSSKPGEAKGPSPVPPKKSEPIASEPDPAMKQLLDNLINQRNPAPAVVS
jgi:transcriptional regulator with XRE-family HTH domain